MTKEQLIAQCKAENPKMIATILGQKVELSSAEYEKACEDWANMRLEQIAYEAEIKQKQETAMIKLAALGLTPDDFKALGLNA